MYKSDRRLGRRAACRLGLAAPLLLVTASARSAPHPMGVDALRDLLRFYSASRKELSVQTADIADRLRQRDREAARIVAGSDGAFVDWPATGRIVRWSDDSSLLGIAVELVEGIGLQTYLGDDFDPTNTALEKKDPLVEVARTSKDRSLRVSGTLVLAADGGPFDALSITPKAGSEISLMTTFKAIRHV